MRYWELFEVSLVNGWRRLGNATEKSLGQELDRDEAKLIKEYKPKVVNKDD